MYVYCPLSLFVNQSKAASLGLPHYCNRLDLLLLVYAHFFSGNTRKKPLVMLSLPVASHYGNCIQYMYDANSVYLKL